MNKWWIACFACLFMMTACSQKTSVSELENAAKDAAIEVQENAEDSVDTAKTQAISETASPADMAAAKAEKLIEAGNCDEAIHILYDAESEFGVSEKLEKLYALAIERHPFLHAEPKKLKYGKDVSGMKRIGGGSSLVYKFTRDGETIAAFKPFQKRYQSNYRSEIAAYRLCPVIKCGFDIPTNVPVYFDFDDFSSMYSHNSANVQNEFVEIIPTKLEDGSYRVDGTYKDWVKEYAEYPIEFTNYWEAWLSPATDRSELMKSTSYLLDEFAAKHKRGQKFSDKLAPHMVNLTVYQLARQISNLVVFDFLINNWDRFSGAPGFFGVNCQIAHGRFISIDNGASFSQSPNEKPYKRLLKVKRFSRMTYDAIKQLDRDVMMDYLFPQASEFEKEKFETFWHLRGEYLDYVAECVSKNGEAETFFFE